MPQILSYSIFRKQIELEIKKTPNAKNSKYRKQKRILQKKNTNMENAIRITSFLVLETDKSEAFEITGSSSNYSCTEWRKNFKDHVE